ncbi:rRNA maturation RNase YbeY [Candidatus Ishikawella capsulata]|uniref:Endoribonuclease YbeY n=1 Tax=Candidatus Ishikawaella capsulata Mpkobe TaxID=476281 RepID=C5WDE3_9ENTR|nr:rRNA maturation RNase YbeY [Candidatus Ishikawaella capsulata]BAH83349.1 hypothetical protein ICMP_502 [Candidatus Ishikawaella capsulata Mpkobe]
MGQLILNLQIACKNTINLPKESAFYRWISATFHIINPCYKHNEITIRLVEKEESLYLNKTYRGINKATNILSFLLKIPINIDTLLLGDLIICRDILEQEAKEQNKKSEEHWAHIVIHGTLHLLGYNHINNIEAQIMEELETKILVDLNYRDPYFIDKDKL